MTEENTVEGAGSQGVSRRTIMKGAAWTVPALMVATAAPAYASSCAKGKWSAIGRGKMLSGGLFNVNLDTLASVNGTMAVVPNTVGTAAETGFVFGQGTAHPSDPDIHHNPLDVSLLSTVNVNATNLTTTLSAILGLVAPADTGVINQFGFAQSDGLSKGASGYVDDSGTARLQPNTGYPTFASLDLKALLTPILGSPTTGILANIANLNLEIGAVMGRAIYEKQCNTVVHAGGYTLDRDYLLAHLRLIIKSGLVGALVTAVGTAVNAVFNNLLNTVVLNALTSAVAVLIYGPSGQGRMGIDTTLITGQIPSGANQPIQMNLGQGTVIVDLSTLLSNNADPFGAASSPWLSGRAANTALFVDYPLPSLAIGNFTAGVVNSLEDILLDAVYVEVRKNGASPWVRYSLRSLQTLPGLAGAVLTPVIGLLNGAVIGTTVTVALTAVSNLLAGVFGALTTVINIKLNEQNLPQDNVPNPWGTKAGPGRWSAGGAQPLPAGRYDVAALGIHAVNALPAGQGVLDLFLARGSVGPHLAI